MHKAVHDYTAAKEGLKSLIPPMPDLYCRHADGVYSLQPLTADGRRFVAEYDGFFNAAEIRVGESSVFPIFDAAFDAGLRIV